MAINLIANSTVAVPSGGAISIVVGRSTLQVAPDSVRFSVDLSNATFDTPGPAAGEVYDPRTHDLVYLWDTGDTGQWAAPVNVLSEWNNKALAKGAAFAHCYTGAGSYAVSVLVVEPSTGKVSQAAATVVVADPDTVYPAAQTVCINPAGDSDFTGSPTGAQTVNMDGVSAMVTSQAWWAALQSENRRYLFKGGATYGEIGFDYEQAQGPNPLISSYGTGKATVQPANAQSGRFLEASTAYSATDVRIEKINCVGTFDPLTQVPEITSGVSNNFIRFSTPGNLVVSECTTQGNKNAAIALFMGGGAGENTTDSAYAHLNDVAVNDLGGQYGGFYAGQHDRMVDSWLSVSGSRLSQNPEALASGSQQRAPMRENGFHVLNLRCLDVYGHADANAGVKMCTTPQTSASKHIINVHGLSVEGGSTPIQIGQNIGAGVDVTIAVNAVLDGLIVVTDYSTVAFGDSQVTGVVVRNLLGIVPDTPRLHDSEVAGFSMNAEESLSNPQVTYTSRRMVNGWRFYREGAPSEEALSAPCHVLNSTLVADRLPGSNGGRAVAQVAFDEQFNNTRNENNIWQGTLWPNDVDYGELTVIELFVPRNIGFAGYVSGPTNLTQNGHVSGLVTEFATPPDAVRQNALPAPVAASGVAAYLDLYGRVRTGTPNIGAY